MLADVWILDPYAVPFGRCAMGVDRLALSSKRARLCLTPFSGMSIVRPVARTLVSLPIVQEDVDLE